MSSTRSQLIRILTVLILLGALVATPTAAHARSFERPDALRDVVRIDGRDGTVTAAPHRVNGDIIRTVFRHTNDKVRMRMRFADLERSVLIAVLVGILTNERVRRVAVFVVERPRRGGHAYLLNRNEKRVSCAVHHSISYRHNVMTIGLPRTCVSDPRWVRMFATTYTVQRNDEFFDHALEGAPDHESAPPYSPRLNRGNRA